MDYSKHDKRLFESMRTAYYMYFCQLCSLPYIIYLSFFRLSVILRPLGVDISFSALSYTISEGDSFLNVTVNKVGTTNFIASVTLQSSDGTALGTKLLLYVN